MYEPNEIELSWKYLQEVIRAIDEPVVVLGGWAVYFLIGERYHETCGRAYIGSMDIDIGFRIRGRDLDKSSFAQTYKVLVEKLGFRPLSFRLFKEIHAETGELLEGERAKKTPLHQIIPIYLDLVVDAIPLGFKKHFGFTPIDEPLLGHVFASKRNRVELKEFGRTVWVPTPEILLAMKVNSCPSRDKEHKRIKDICDIAALLLFAPQAGDRKKLIALAGLKKLEKLRASLSKAELTSASELIGLDTATMERALQRIS